MNMSKQDDKPPEHPPPAAPAEPKGRVVHDARGNAKWEFDVTTGKFKSTASQLLKKLDASGLEMVDDVAGNLSMADPGAGYDPYNQVSGRSAAKPGSKAPPPPPGKPKARR
jgi:hypothetical protein